MVCVIFGILVVMFLFSGCSMMFLDWQFYKWSNLHDNESGIYIFDKKLYDEAEQLNIGGILSNGYKLVYRGAEFDIENIDSRIRTYKRYQNSYIDSNNTEHIISYARGFDYIKYGLWITAGLDSGVFSLKTKGEIGGIKRKDNKIVNIFYLRDGKWVKTEN